MHYEMFPPEIIALQEELTHHPELMKTLAAIPATDLELRLGEIAAYAEVVLDGMYTPVEVARVCIPRLQQKRSLLWIPQGFSSH